MCTEYQVHFEREKGKQTKRTREHTHHQTYKSRASANLQPQYKAQLQVYLPSLLQGHGPLPRCQTHPESRYYSWVKIMALAPTHMHPTDIRPLITKYKHHGSQADYRALWTCAFKALPDIDVPNDYQEISQWRPTKRDRDQGTDAWHTHAPNSHTITDSPPELYGQRLCKDDIFTNTQQVQGRSSQTLQRMW